MAGKPPLTLDTQNGYSALDGQFAKRHTENKRCGRHIKAAGQIKAVDRLFPVAECLEKRYRKTAAVNFKLHQKIHYRHKNDHRYAHKHIDHIAHQRHEFVRTALQVALDNLRNHHVVPERDRRIRIDRVVVIVARFRHPFALFEVVLVEIVKPEGFAHGIKIHEEIQAAAVGHFSCNFESIPLVGGTVVEHHRLSDLVAEFDACGT